MSIDDAMEVINAAKAAAGDAEKALKWIEDPRQAAEDELDKLVMGNIEKVEKTVNEAIAVVETAAGAVGDLVDGVARKDLGGVADAVVLSTLDTVETLGKGVFNTVEAVASNASDVIERTLGAACGAVKWIQDPEKADEDELDRLVMGNIERVEKTVNGTVAIVETTAGAACNVVETAASAVGDLVDGVARGDAGGVADAVVLGTLDTVEAVANGAFNTVEAVASNACDVVEGAAGLACDVVGGVTSVACGAVKGVYNFLFGDD